ncbi:MAG: anthranilate synthase component II [Bacillota bacterium]
MILVIDNYDSFTYNLVQILGELGAELTVYRNDRITSWEAERLNPSHLVVSPGPGHPGQAGVSKEMIRLFAGRIPILGVCLGHQCIGEVFGGKIVKAKHLMHGKTSRIYHNDKGVFRGVEDGFIATRYHSLMIDKDTLPEALEITGKTDDGEIMAIEHRDHPTFGLQFHPESILTKEGKKILGNFLKMN